MAGVRINALPEKVVPSDTGDWYVLDDGTTAQRIDFDTLAKSIIESYDGTELDGVSQDLKTAINALYTALAAATTPATATSSYETGFTNYTTGSVPTFVKVGRVVMVYGQAKPTSTITGGTTNVKMFTIPAGYRPASPVTVLQQASGARIWLLSLQNGYGYFGRVRDGSTWANVTSSEWLPFYACYICDPEA